MPTPNPPSDLPPAGKLFVSEPGEGATDDVIANDFSANTNRVDRSAYRGQYVAWSTDGRSVIDADPSLSTLLRRMTRRGKNDFVVEGIPDS